MPLINKPQQYGDNAAIVSSAIPYGQLFDEPVSALTVVNDRSTGSVYLDVTSTSGSTGGFEVKMGETYSLDSMLLDGFSLASTSTSTSDTCRWVAYRG